MQCYKPAVVELPVISTHYQTERKNEREKERFSNNLSAPIKWDMNFFIDQVSSHVFGVVVFCERK